MRIKVFFAEFLLAAVLLRSGPYKESFMLLTTEELLTAELLLTGREN